MVLAAIAFLNAALTACAILLDDLQSRTYRVRDLVRMLVLAPLDLVLYRPIIVWARLKGSWRFLRGDKAWHKFERNVRARLDQPARVSSFDSASLVVLKDYEIRSGAGRFEGVAAGPARLRQVAGCRGREERALGRPRSRGGARHAVLAASGSSRPLRRVGQHVVRVLGWYLAHDFLTFPSASMTNVERSIPMYVLPYMLFSTQARTPPRLRAPRRRGARTEAVLLAELHVLRRTVRAHAEDDRARALELAPDVADPAGLPCTRACRPWDRSRGRPAGRRKDSSETSSPE